jgi:predicted acylesterase/phospholipase RssA
MDQNLVGKYSDGSVESDLPMEQLAELFNVNHFIVCQVPDCTFFFRQLILFHSSLSLLPGQPSLATPLCDDSSSLCMDSSLLHCYRWALELFEVLTEELAPKPCGCNELLLYRTYLGEQEGADPSVDSSPFCTPSLL